VVTERGPAVHEQPYSSRYLAVVAGFGGEHEHRRAAAVGPVRSGVVSHGYQGFPSVGGVVIHGHVEFCPLQCGEVGA
jgi:hypothetical protein